MSYLSEYCTVVRSWIDDEDISDDVIETWVRDAEERINNELRVDIMIQRTQATFDDQCAELPPDCLEVLYLKYAGGRPLTFIVNQAYWDLTDPDGVTPTLDPKVVYDPLGHRRKAVYTIVGRTLFILPGFSEESKPTMTLGYYQQIQPLGDFKSGVFDRFPAIYRNCTLAAGAPYLMEDERVPTWAGLATALIEKANAAHKRARFGGSPITPVIRGFG